MKRITHRQTDILIYAYHFYLRNDQLPPFKTIATHFEMASSNAIQDHFCSLLDKGYLERNEIGKYKFTAKARKLVG